MGNDDIKKNVINHARNDMANLPPEKPPVQPVEQHKPKIGEGHMAGMMRLGMKELSQALPAFPDSTVKPVEEQGVFGNATPQIITNEMGYKPEDLALYQPPAKTKGRSR